MTAKELAKRLSGRAYMKEITSDEKKQAADAGLVVVFGYSDDSMEFCGAIHDDEVGCYDGGIAYPTKDGILREPDCNTVELCTCPYFDAIKSAAKAIKAVWHDDGGPCWTYETDIPHETFDIYEDGEVWCVGIVFSMEDLGMKAGAEQSTAEPASTTPNLATEVGRVMYIIEHWPMTVADVEIYANFCEETALHGKTLAIFLQEAITAKRDGKF